MTPFGKITVHEDDLSVHVDKVRRITVAGLDGSFGTDRDKRLVVSLLKGDLIEVRPERTQRAETIRASDLFRILIQRRVALGNLERARVRKEAKARRREAQSIRRAEKRLVAN